MVRALKHPENTSYYTFENLNPKGHRASDCVVRAIASATNIPYDEIFDTLYGIARVKKFMPNDPQVWEYYLKANGWVKQPTQKKQDNTRFKGFEFAKMIETTAIISIGSHHLSVIKDHKIHDTWDCSKGAVGNYWIKVVN